MERISQNILTYPCINSLIAFFTARAKKKKNQLTFEIVSSFYYLVNPEI